MSALPVAGHPSLALPTDPEGTVAVRTADGTTPTAALLELVVPMPGLPDLGPLRLEPLDDLGVLFALRSLPGAEPGLRLFVVAPEAFFPGYAPDLTDAAAALVAPDAGVTGPGVTGPAAAPVLLVVVHPVDDAHESPTANLLAPLVVDPTTGRAVQTVLEGDWPLRARLG